MDPEIEPTVSAQDNLYSLVERAFQGEHFMLRSGGENKAVLMGVGEFQAMQAAVEEVNKETEV